MKRGVMIAAGALALCGVLGGGAALAQSLGDTSAVNPVTASSTTGEATYREVCRACHMANAEGGTGAGVVPALAANPHLADKDFVVTRVLRGQGGMPAFAELLSPEQVAGVVGYVRTHFGNAYPEAVTLADVKRLAPVSEAD